MTLLLYFIHLTSPWHFSTYVVHCSLMLVVFSYHIIDDLTTIPSLFVHYCAVWFPPPSIIFHWCWYNTKFSVLRLNIIRELAFITLPYCDILTNLSNIAMFYSFHYCLITAETIKATVIVVDLAAVSLISWWMLLWSS